MIDQEKEKEKKVGVLCEGEGLLFKGHCFQLLFCCKLVFGLANDVALLIKYTQNINTLVVILIAWIVVK